MSHKEEEIREMQQYYKEPEEGATISGILGMVFPPSKETEESVHLDEETFEPIEAEDLPGSRPTDEELEKYPELEYTTEEVQHIVSQMSRDQYREFKQYENYFLTRYRQTGNMMPLYMEVRGLVKQMCPAMPGQLQEAIVEAWVQLLAEARLKELSKQLGVPVARREVVPMVHPIDEGLLGKAAAPMMPEQLAKATKAAQVVTPSEIPGVSKIQPVPVPMTEDIKPVPILATQLMTDTMLKVMEGVGDESCRIIRVTRGRDPNYDLAKGDQELEEALGLVTEDLILGDDVEDMDDLSVVTMDSMDRVDNKEAAALLTKLADAKAKEVEVIQELTALVQAEQMGPEEVTDTVQSMVRMQGNIPELALIMENYDYEATRMILAAGFRMRQIYYRNM